MSKKLLLCFALFIGLVSFAMAQRTVTGTITDETASPVIQATVVVKGTTQGTVTDENGKFKLENVANNATLVVSYAGAATQEINSGVLTQIDVSLKSDASIGEVVIQGGYLVEEKRSAVGAIAGVKGSTIENLPMQSFDRAMQGRIAGVQIAATSGQPGGALSVRIRGVNSISAGLEPLYIIDGIQVRQGAISGQGSSNALASINPNDIESIEVLKDAAASAIYGAQAANGVVLITTKRGKNGPSQINFSVQEGVVQPMNLYNVMNAQQFAQIKQASYVNNGSPASAATALFGDPSNPNLPSYSWTDAVFRTGRQKSYDISVNGGDAKTSFYISGAFTRQEGQVQQNFWQRGSLKANFTHQATDKLSIGLALNGSWQNSYGAIENGNFVNGPFSTTFALQPYSPAVNPETGAYNLYPTTSPGSHSFGYNILQGLNQEVRTGKTFQFLGSTNIGYKLTKDLTLNFLGALDFVDGRDDNQRPATIPAFAAQGGSSFVSYRRIFNFNGNVNLQYSKTFNTVHKVSGILGYEYKIEQDERANATGRQFANPFFRQLSSAAVPVSVGGTYTEYVRQGIFGQAKYDYNDTYFVDFTLRRDGSSRFGQDNRWGVFYAAAAAWRISQEGFMESLKSTVTDLKLRVSYGVLGNSDIGNFDYIGLFGTSGATGASYNGTSLLRQTQLGNGLLAWEKQAQFNVGTDIELWKGKVTLSVDYWNKLTTDLLFNRQIAADGGAGYDGGNASGGSYVIRGNTGKLLNRGFDVDLKTNNIDKNGFKWSTSFNISFLRNEILELPDGKQRIGTSLFVGQPVSVIWGAEYAGVNPANGRVVVLDTLGNPTYSTGTVLTQKILAKSIPTYYGGFSNTFSYKNITLDIFFQYQGGNSAFLGDFYNQANGGVTADNQLVSQLAYWQKPGDVTNVPRPVEGGIVEGQDQYGFSNSRFVSDASYIRLKQVRLSYEVPSNILSKFKVRRVNVYAQAINLWTYTKFAGIDPEVVGQTSANGASTYGTYPQGRQFNVGLAFGF